MRPRRLINGRHRDDRCIGRQPHHGVDACRSRRANVRSARVGTSARRAGRRLARCRCPRCPTDCSAAAAPASSIRRPKARTGRSPRRHIASRSANAGSSTRPAQRTSGDTAKSVRARPAAAGGRSNVARRLNGSRANCLVADRHCAGFLGAEPHCYCISATEPQISQFLERSAAGVDGFAIDQNRIFHDH